MAKCPECGGFITVSGCPVCNKAKPDYPNKEESRELFIEQVKPLIKPKETTNDANEETAKSNRKEFIAEKLSPIIEKFQADNGIKMVEEKKTEKTAKKEKTDDVIDEDTTQKDIDYILQRRKEKQKAKKTAEAEKVVETKPEETKTDVVIETAEIDEQTLKTGPIDFSKDIKPVEKVKEEEIDPATYSVPVYKFTKPDTKTKSFSFNRQLVIIAIAILVLLTGLIIFVRGINNTTTDNSSLDETTIITDTVINSIPYEDTGTTGTKTWTNLVINDDEYLIVGGLTGNINGVDYENGFCIGIGPGTHNLTITNGFRHIVPSKEAPDKFDFRVAQATTYGWACSHIDRGPIPVA